MGGTSFKLNLNLQNLSMISIAAKLWDSQDIKHRIKNHFSGLECRYSYENWTEISKLVVQNANSINLPPSVSVLLKKTILRIGQKIYVWIRYVTKILKLDFIFTEKIYFSFGAIDEIKIFDLYWRDLMAPDNSMYQSDYCRHSPLFSLACMYGCEKFVKERKNDMLDELKDFYPQIKEGDEIYNIFSVSICRTEQKSLLENVASPRQMFELCLEKCYSKAARYYWEKLDEAEKVSNLYNFAKKCFVHYYDDFLMEKVCENLLFLINQMGDEKRYLFFTDYADKIIRLFLPIWPYQELIVDLLKYDWNIESSRLRTMANFLISFNEHMSRLEFPLVNELVFQIMQKVWGSLPVNEKLLFLTENHFRISNLFSTFNPDIINLLLNDPSITEVDREKVDIFIKREIKRGFIELVRMEKFDVLNAVIGTILNYIPEPKEFLKKNLSDARFVREESFGLVDHLLIWSAESEAEKARFKDKINTICVSRYRRKSETDCSNLKKRMNF